ncbi:protein BatD [Leptobacterium flavescens]|uniref:Protein BatD n=1 Tax=Leptobacterium flavescens TaxID=472055 RepID=A0A6P0UQS4_9FLAO|nr:BatD family protein [Leptobacterium flavescens]NER14338.1 protein BatD [Leptobacterium flavescens]
MKKVLLLIIAFLNVFVTLAQDGVVFEAKVSKEKLGINERLLIEFTMNKDGDNFTPPSFEGFRVNSPQQSISQVYQNGKKSLSKTYSYILTPKARGKFTIKQATVEIEGKIFKTLPIKIEVTAAVEKPSDSKTADDIADDNLHLVAEVSKQSPFLNEAVSVVYKLYVSPNINVSDFRQLDNPKYNNFWSQDLPIKRWKIENGTYKGRSYRYVVLKRVVLYPQKTGKLSIEPLSLDVTVDVPTNRRDFFGGRIYTQTHKTVSAGNRTIRVKELPSGKPEGFSGAVGSFDFNVIPSKTDLKATESLQLKVEVNGKGNLKLFELPEINLPSSLEVYEPKFDANVSTNLTGTKGKVADNYTIVPQFRGKYPIPSVSFSYFDPKEEKYKTIKSQEILINVFEGPVGSGVTGAPISSPGFNKKAVVTAGNQFRFLKLNPNLQPVQKKDLFKSNLFYSLLLLPLLIIPIAIVVGKKKKLMEADVAGNRIKKANKLAKKYLSEAKKAIGKKELFYESLERALHNYLKAKLHIETSEFSKEKISDLLLSRKVSGETVTNFISLLESCELARYTPASEVTIQHDYNKAAEVISQIDKQIQ